MPDQPHIRLARCNCLLIVCGLAQVTRRGEEWQKHEAAGWASLHAAEPQPHRTVWTQPLKRDLAPNLGGCVGDQRKLSVLNFAFAQRCHKLGVTTSAAASDPEVRRRVANELWVDVGASIPRGPWRCSPSLPVVTRRSQWYSFGEDKFVGPELALAVYGRQLSREQWAALGATKKERDMIGNCMAAQPMAAIMHAVVFVVSSGAFEALASPHAARVGERPEAA